MEYNMDNPSPVDFQLAMMLIYPAGQTKDIIDFMRINTFF